MLANIFCKVYIVTILSFVVYVVSIAFTQLCYCMCESSHKQYVKYLAWLCSITTLFTKMVGVPVACPHDKEYCHYCRNFLHAPSQSVSNHTPPTSWPLLSFFHHRLIYPALDLHRNGITQYVLLCKISLIQYVLKIDPCCMY